MLRNDTIDYTEGILLLESPKIRKEIVIKKFNIYVKLFIATALEKGWYIKPVYNKSFTSSKFYVSLIVSNYKVLDYSYKKGSKLITTKLIDIEEDISKYNKWKEKHKKNSYLGNKINEILVIMKKQIFMFLNIQRFLDEKENFFNKKNK